MKNISISPRIIAIFAFAIAATTLICFGLYTFADPQFAQIATETNEIKTKDAGFVIETNVINTQDADATAISLQQTQTAFPTATLTATQPPTLVSCSANLPDGTLLYSGPSKGFTSKRTTQTKVDIVAHAKNTSWYKIDSQLSEYVWVQEKSVEIDNSCQPVSVSLSYLAGWNDKQEVVLEENFSTTYSWTNDKDKLIFSMPFSLDKDYQVLPIAGSPRSLVYLRNQPFSYMNNLLIRSSFYWARSGSFGYRFWDDGVNYYDVVVNQDCNIQVYDSGKLLLQRPSITEVYCYYGHINYFEVGVSVDGVLSMKVNEIEPYLFQLENIYQGEGFALIADNNASTEVEYIIITTAP